MAKQSATSTSKIESDIEASPRFALLLILGGVVGWLAAFSLIVERIRVATDPSAVLSCDVSPFISCKSVMLSEQAALFGFPNPIIGLASFMAPIVVGFAILAGAKFKPWFWQLFALGNLLGFIFVIWLFSQSLLVINVLCPYCMVAWAAMIPMFWAVTFLGLRDGFIPAPIRATEFLVRAYDWHWLASLLTYVVIIGAIAIRFWPFWHTLF